MLKQHDTKSPQYSYQSPQYSYQGQTAVVPYLTPRVQQTKQVPWNEQIWVESWNSTTTINLPNTFIKGELRCCQAVHREATKMILETSKFDLKAEQQNSQSLHKMNKSHLLCQALLHPEPSKEKVHWNKQCPQQNEPRRIAVPSIAPRVQQSDPWNKQIWVESWDSTKTISPQ